MHHTISTLLDERRQLVTGAMSETLASAVQRMGEAGVGAIVVVRDGALVGMCTERSILRRVVTDRLDPTRATLGHIVSAPVLCAEPDMRIDEALRLMTRTRTRHLPVVREGQLVGIVSIGDLTHWLIAELEDQVGDLTGYIAGGAVRNPTKEQGRRRAAW